MRYQITLLSISLVLFCLVPWMANGQRVISRWHEVGELREEYESDGSWTQGEWPHAQTIPGESRNTNIDESGHWLGARDFTDKDGTHFDYFVAEGGGIPSKTIRITTSPYRFERSGATRRRR